MDRGGIQGETVIAVVRRQGIVDVVCMKMKKVIKVMNGMMASRR